MAVIHRCRAFSIIANLTALESFILHDPTSQDLYHQYLAQAFPSGTKANHIPFFVDLVSLGDRASNIGKGTQAPEYYAAELCIAYERYFQEDSDYLLDIPHERLLQVRRNVAKGLTLVAFKPAIKAVIKDLAFIYMTSFINSEIFKEHKATQLAEFNMEGISESASQREKENTFKLRRFFGETLVNNEDKVSRGEQPEHIKEYKLSKIFGERISVDKTALLSPSEKLNTSTHYKSRDRRLHVFFGDNFQVEETLFSERVRSRSFGSFNDCDFRNQPTHVSSFRLARFFGVRTPISESKELTRDSECTRSPTEEDGVLARHSKTQHIMRFFGERIDPSKEATAVSFAYQPKNVKGCTLKKIFGESAAHTLQFDPNGTSGTWPRTSRYIKTRAKLEKIFGPFEG